MSLIPQSATGRHPLFEPYRMGPIELPNRFVMAPLTRMRADNPHGAPTALHAEYYAQRAGAGFIIGEADAIRAMTAVGHYAQPRDIADAVAFLARAEAGFVTGASWNVGGGYAL